MEPIAIIERPTGPQPVYTDLLATLAREAGLPITTLEETAMEATYDEDTSEDRCTDHGYDECPDCGNGGVRIEDGYVPCTRFLTCWSDPTD